MSEVKERILRTASELFYTQGYRGTGINQIIQESDIAKATFYSHFPSKEDLGVAYLMEMRRAELELLEKTLSRRKEAVSRFLTGIEILEQWLIETEFRGCYFLNIAAEEESLESPLRKIASDFYVDYGKRLAELSEELIQSDAKRFGHLRAKTLGIQYLTIVAGTVSLCAIFRSIEPYHNGVKMVRSLIE